jgi:hypothetical protein
MKKILVLGFILASSAQAFAAGYGAAGCGLGSMLFEGKNEWYEQVMAATTNGTSGNQTFGITFGSLNCDANKVALNSEKATVFVAANKNAVVNELALGQGESVSVLANIFECQNAAAFADVMKANYNQVISNNQLSNEEIVANMSKVVESTKVCQPNLG